MSGIHQLQLVVFLLTNVLKTWRDNKLKNLRMGIFITFVMCDTDGVEKSHHESNHDIICKVAH